MSSSATASKTSACAGSPRTASSTTPPPGVSWSGSACVANSTQSESHYIDPVDGWTRSATPSSTRNGRRGGSTAGPLLARQPSAIRADGPSRRRFRPGCVPRAELLRGSAGDEYRLWVNAGVAEHNRPSGPQNGKQVRARHAAQTSYARGFRASAAGSGSRRAPELEAPRWPRIRRPSPATARDAQCRQGRCDRGRLFGIESRFAAGQRERFRAR